MQRRHGDQFNGFHLSAFWSKFKALVRGELGVGLGDRLAPVCEQTVRMLPELDARKVSTIAHAFAKAELVGTGPWERVWEALPEAVRDVAATHFNGGGHHNAAGGACPGESLDSVVARLIGLLPSYASQLQDEG